MGKAGTSTTQIVDKLTDAGKSVFLADFKSLVKIGIVNSNLITTFTGFWLALYFTDATFSESWQIFLLTMAGTALVIAGGCMMNNWYDVDVDPVMDRTKSRPTVTGSAPLNQVLILGITSTVAGIVLLLFTTVVAAAIALFGWIAYVFFYTMWAKRKYTLNTIVGSFSGAVPPLVGWTAIAPHLDIVAVVLFLIMFIWQTPHFLALAMKKSEEYKDAGIPMLPVVHGFAITKRQMVVYTACLLPLPFYLSSLGTMFLIIATALNVGWLLLGISGFFMKSDFKWANWMFIYSLNYLTIIFVLMVAVTFNFPLS